MQNGPAGPSLPSPAAQQDRAADVEMKSDGRCQDVRPGDLVHYSLTIESVANPRAVFADLRLRPKGSVAPRASALPSPDFRNLGGGGLARRDDTLGNVYHFVFRVPKEILSGVYHGVALDVTAGDGVAARRDPGDVDVSRHVREQVRSYCLNVFSAFGGNNKPEVTDFTPGIVDKP